MKAKALDLDPVEKFIAGDAWARWLANHRLSFSAIWRKILKTRFDMNSPHKITGLCFILLYSFTHSLLPAADPAWSRATAPRDWQFPRDHGAHPDYKTEWWYFTGNLATQDGRRFGYQLTFFRQGLRLSELKSTSRWTLTDLYFAHFTITDVKNDKFHFTEKLNRGSLGQVETSTTGMFLRMENWRIQTIGPDRYQLLAENDEFGLSLEVAAVKSLVLQGNKGLSQKGAEPGNASHYYSYTRMKSSGTIRIGKESFPVNGLSWFDHEFSTSSLSADQAGWDWFSIQLENGEELMLYQIRRQDGSKDPLSKGTWVLEKAGIPLQANDFTIEATDQWKSPLKGKYPASWKITIPKLEAVLEVRPQVKDQELRLSALSEFSYWEGTCKVEGIVKGQKVTGYGYTELTGYASPVGPEMK